MKIILAFFCLICTCGGDTGSGVRPSQQSNLVPLDVITELQALTLDLQKDFNRVTKENAKILKDNKVLAAEVATLRHNVSVLQSESNLGSTALNDLTSVVQSKMTGAVFTRWGRSTCPWTSELVYAGSVGGAWYDADGVAVNYLCLPKQPQWLSQISGYGQNLYGGEYGGTDFGQQNGDDAPCVVCRTTANSVVMIPARTSCYSGWTRQYYGYLGAGDYSHKAASEYICVDRNAEAITRGRTDNNGKILRSVRTNCGSLPCPPYESGKSVTCVVCSK